MACFVPGAQGAYLIPLAKPYKHPVPDQSKCVQIAFLGHGVVSMRNIPRLPSPAHLTRRIKELQDEVRRRGHVHVCACACANVCACVCAYVYMHAFCVCMRVRVRACV